MSILEYLMFVAFNQKTGVGPRFLTLARLFKFYSWVDS